MYRVDKSRWKTALVVAGTTQRAIAERLGWRERHLSDVVCGARPINVRALIVLAAAVGVRDPGTLAVGGGEDVFVAEVSALAGDLQLLRANAGRDALDISSDTIAGTAAQLRDIFADLIPGRAVGPDTLRRIDQAVLRFYAKVAEHDVR
jgi:hypothetical protein